MNAVRYLWAVLIAVALIVSKADAGVVFSNPTDTISVAGNISLSSQATYEATIDLTSTSYTTAGFGTIFEAWQNDSEDEHFGVCNGGTAWAYSYPLNFGTAIQGGNLETGVSYDLAYVYDGSQERLYINGSEVASRSAAGNILEGSTPSVAIGANEQPGYFSPSFLGDIQSLRISDTARYSGSSYTLMTGDFTSDSSTLLLYDFDQLASNSTSITDLSGNGHTGTFGVGFLGATSPAVPVPEPTMFSVLSVLSIVLLGFERRLGRSKSFGTRAEGL